MNKQTLGTCGNCGGAVTVDTIFFSVIPPKPRCESCGASPVECHGPVIPMQPAPKRFSWFGVGSELPSKDSLEQALKDRMALTITDSKKYKYSPASVPLAEVLEVLGDSGTWHDDDKEYYKNVSMASNSKPEPRPL